MKKQKVWFITGASKGFGLEIAKAALKAGDKVAATVRGNAENLKAIFNNEENALVVTLDVTKEDQVKQGVQDAINKFGRLDVLVNNAGYGLLGATEEVSDYEVRKQYDTNVFGLLNVTRAVLPHMRSQKSGHIINISSLLGYTASVPGFGLYGSTKFAVEGITEGLALEVKPLGIYVTTAAPGYFRTKFASTESYQASEIKLDAYKETVGHIREFISQIDGNQPGDPVRLAQAIIKLAASENPPIHLPLGSDSVAAFRMKTAQAGKEVDEWENISNSTDYPKN
ncbi:oxidoreductase [Chitinophaga pinensis]|uniref:Short-chain dehydrogenase/reductase SDR n=1 Tax=Chitinophaga pinensis (strain ATCC 43595 / DSM 2588 / LMG 13176 / NBRC 15968 / NCIMB 11800 / UQM 2034) TaxID=485918 RepID=A0A979G485_CHIPD|nr:oxidoreductase [Chitinophaga pinensis]ACU60421.1 short-chain dehydrogenase/reductase SDR [Chitinophaga pinensis DSM 2588]